jgi:tetratricopeptide (TPR) repeat protein
LDPRSVEALNNLSWILATTPEAALRNGPRAVELGRQACALTGESQPGLLGTLAAAYAEAGRFPEAIATAQKAIALAEQAGNPEVAAINRKLLAEYEAGRPHREP